MKRILHIIAGLLIASTMFVSCGIEPKADTSVPVVATTNKDLQISVSPNGMIKGIYGVSILEENQVEKKIYFNLSPSARAFYMPINETTEKAINLIKTAASNNTPLKFEYSAYDNAPYALVRNVSELTNEEKANYHNLSEGQEEISFSENGSPEVEARLTSVIPSLDRATEIFNFMRSQTCGNNPSYRIPGPCIPFKYVVDGCYARAHKMKQILEQRYGIDCMKVFIFGKGTIANSRPTLTVTQTSTGCCVTWGWHVAPLVKVQTQQGVVEYVFDPSMFDKPVTLSTWYNATRRPNNCEGAPYLRAFYRMSARAYAPIVNKDAFATDDSYIQTNQTLQSYSSLSGCGN